MFHKCCNVAFPMVSLTTPTPNQFIWVREIVRSLMIILVIQWSFLKINWSVVLLVFCRWTWGIESTLHVANLVPSVFSLFRFLLCISCGTKKSKQCIEGFCWKERGQKWGVNTSPTLWKSWKQCLAMFGKWPGKWQQNGQQQCPRPAQWCPRGCPKS